MIGTPWPRTLKRLGLTRRDQSVPRCDASLLKSWTFVPHEPRLAKNFGCQTPLKVLPLDLLGRARRALGRDGAPGVVRLRVEALTPNALVIGIAAKEVIAVAVAVADGVVAAVGDVVVVAVDLIVLGPAVHFLPGEEVLRRYFVRQS